MNNTNQLATLAAEYAAGIRGYYEKTQCGFLSIETAVAYAVESWLTEIRVWGNGSAEYAADDLEYWKGKWAP